MQRSRSILFLLLFPLLTLATGLGAVKNKPPKKIQIDSSKISLRKFDEHAIQKFKTDKDFNYTGEAASFGASLWNRFWAWVWEKIANLFVSVPFSGTILKYTLLALSIAFLVYIIFKSVGIDVVKLWQGNAQKAGLHYTESLENIHEINFDTEIEKAVSLRNYSLAVRLLYLRCLKQLSDKNLIQWQIDKTNSTYVFELNDTVQKSSFALLTKQFEYVWYGNFLIDKQAFGSINQLFQDFKNQIS